MPFKFKGPASACRQASGSHDRSLAIPCQGERKSEIERQGREGGGRESVCVCMCVCARQSERETREREEDDELSDRERERQGRGRRTTTSLAGETFFRKMPVRGEGKFK